MKIFRLEIWKYNYWDFFSKITQYINSSEWKGRSIFTPNPEICLKTLEDEEFLWLLMQADYLTSDGIGLYLAYQINDSKLPKFLKISLLPVYILNIILRKKYLYKKYWERICGSDLSKDLVKYASKHGIRVAILDLYNPWDVGKVASQKVFQEKLQRVFPELLFDFYIYRSKEKEKIFQSIDHSWAKIVFSTLWMKKQELSILEALNSCNNLRIGLWIGSSFDYFIWYQKRAPQLWRSAGFEWLYRIFTSPWKMQRLKRVYNAVIVFPYIVIKLKK